MYVSIFTCNLILLGGYLLCFWWQLQSAESWSGKKEKAIYHQSGLNSENWKTHLLKKKNIYTTIIIMMTMTMIMMIMMTMVMKTINGYCDQGLQKE